MNYQAVATCLFGLERTVAYELKKVGVEEMSVEDGRIFFSATAKNIADANVWSRTAERILIVAKQFRATDFDTLFDEVGTVRWGDYIERTDAFPVKGYSMQSQLSSVPAMQSIIKKSIVERLKKDHNSSFLTEKSGVTKRVRFSMVKDVCTVMIDTTGEGLHKRGYRPLTHEAPIKETLAAGIVDLARIRKDSLVADPFCGSGTLLIEAAMKAKNIAPGLNRAFSGEEYTFLGKALFDAARAEAREAIVEDASFSARGFDIDETAIVAAKENAKRAGVADCIVFDLADARAFIPKKEEIVLANPPYGERLMTPEQSEKLLGDFFENLSRYPYKGLYVISSQPDFEKTAKRKATRRRKLYNGMIQCQLYMYF